MENIDLPIPFRSIALSLSGGGYRATTFHLGSISLLNALEFGPETLLQRVTILSTISGGTLTGVMYALKMAQGEGYQGCFDKIYVLLQEDTLVKQALYKLNHPNNWNNPHKSRDLINAFSEVYDEHFYERATFADLYENDTGHLHDIVFGASEFTTGIQFRFQRGLEDEMFGNGNLNLPRSASRDIRLADAAAASSCFPGGFEPMVMPKDYGNGPGSTVDEAWSGEEHEPVTAIMDGGVLDNQGIEGVKLAERRHLNNGLPLIGTFLISDVSGESMSPLEVPELNHSSLGNYFTLRSLNFLAGGIFAALVILFFVWDDIPSWGTIVISCLGTLIGLWFLVFLAIRAILVREISATFAGKQLPEILQDFRVLLQTPIYILFYLIKFRALSVMKMVTDVFLRRIRALQLTALYSNPRWNGRIKANNIYTLQGRDTNEIGFKLKRVIEAANTMPTTLWFSQAEKKNHMLDDLIAAGQATLCQNLIYYIEKLPDKNFEGENIWERTPDAEKEKIAALKEKLDAYWIDFKKDPYWLLNRDKQRGNIGNSLAEQVNPVVQK